MEALYMKKLKKLKEKTIKLEKEYEVDGEIVSGSVEIFHEKDTQHKYAHDVGLNEADPAELKVLSTMLQGMGEWFTVKKEDKLYYFQWIDQVL